MRTRILCAAAAFLLLAAASHAMSPEERRVYRDQMMKILPDVPQFDAWIQKTDALPPDFDALPRVNGLPDALHFADGREVKTAEDWKARRAEILDLFEKYAWGKIPPLPKLDQAEVTTESQRLGYRSRSLILHFGPESKATVTVSMMIPDGKGPFPVLLGPGVSSSFSMLLRRGYIGVSMGGPDEAGNAELAALKDIYPDYDFGSIPRLAWTMGMVVNYLETVPEADMSKIAAFGYSRNGKTAAIGAALDDRIKAVIAGSTGVGGVLPYRLAGERNQGESIQSTTMMFPDWFPPKLRFFAGRIDRLPVDGNLLIDLIAPRGCLIEYGMNDEVSNTYGCEAAWRDAEKVYKLLGKPENTGILRVPGFHGANDMEACMDFVDIVMGRSSATWHNDEMFPWNYEQWKTASKESVDLSKYPDKSKTDLLTASAGPIATKEAWEAKAADIRKDVNWVLGEEPPLMVGGGRGGFGGRFGGPRLGGRGGGLARRGGPGGAVGANGSTTGTARGGFPGRGAAAGGRGGAAGGRGAGGFGARGGAGGVNPAQLGPIVDEWVIGRNSNEFGWQDPDRSNVTSRPITFGSGVSGKIYSAVNTPADKKLPAVIWLHGYSYPLGYMWVYRRDLHPVLALAEAGYAVLVYDQSGFGSRMKEIGPFYDRFPHWSQMGRMVEDIQQAVKTLGADPQIDANRIALLGYSIGGTAALHAAALDPAIKAVVAVNGFTPMRTDTADKGDGGLARYSVERGIMPRLGFFIGHEAQTPYDYNELIATIAPRPALIVEPKFDRDGTPAEVKDAVEQARKVYALYGAGDKLALQEPWDYTRLSTPMQDAILKWLGETLDVAAQPKTAAAPASAGAQTP